MNNDKKSSGEKCWVLKKTTKLTKSVFAPLGIVLGIGLIICGIYLFII